jgi:phenylpyruvate tautomerase PptA (4-oxalocrotonate tautomerase family)
VDQLVGRADECTRLREVVDRARDGRAGLLVLRGEAGAGKTTLLNHVQATAAGFDVVRFDGVETEAELEFATLHQLQVPDIPMFRQNTAAFVHDLPADSLSDVDGDSRHVRVQVLTNAGALDRDKQLAVVQQLTDIVAKAAGDESLVERTWVLLTEAPNGGWGLNGHANTNEELVLAARAQLAEIAKG